MLMSGPARAVMVLLGASLMNEGAFSLLITVSHLDHVIGPPPKHHADVTAITATRKGREFLVRLGRGRNDLLMMIRRRTGLPEYS